EVAAGEDDLLAVGGEVAARGLADAGADAVGAAGRQVHGEDLVEGVAALLLLGLEDDGLAVGGEVAFAGADEVLDELLEVGVVGWLAVARWAASDFCQSSAGSAASARQASRGSMRNLQRTEDRGQRTEDTNSSG